MGILAGYSPLHFHSVKELFKKEWRWSFRILDMDRRALAFQDESTGKITSWRWDFGDGATSTEQHPIHQYQKAGEYTVNLYIEGPDGKSRWTKVRNVAVR